MTKVITRLMMILVLASCAAKKNDAVTTQPGTGTQQPIVSRAGSYTLTGVNCYSTGGSLTASATVITATTETLVINGSSVVMTDTSSSCTATYNQTGTFNTTATSGNIISGTFSVTARTGTTSNAGACSQNYGITGNTGATISPSSYSYTANHNSTPSDLSGTFFQDTTTGNFGLSTFYTVPANSTDTCYLMYTKN